MPKRVVLLFSPTCSFIRMRQTSYRGFSRKTKRSYIDDVLSLNISRFGDFVDRIFPIELEIKDTTDTEMSAQYLDLHLENDSDGRLKRNFMTIEMISIFPLWTFHLFVATFHQHLYMEYIYIWVDTIFQSLWFLSGFPWLRVAASKEVTEPRVPLD